MSFLNAVLSSLDTKILELPQSQVQTVKHTPTPTNGKRKAESELTRSQDKAQKVTAQAASTHANGKASVRATPVTVGSVSISRDLSKPIVTASVSAASHTKAPPKKGSYAEIMARAKQAPTIAPVGTITHKPKEKMSSKKELALAKEMALRNKKRPNGKDSKLAVRSKSSSPGPSNHGGGSKQNGKATVAKPIGYSGTAKPKPTVGYKGTMKPLSSTSTAKKRDHSEPRRSESKPPATARRREYYSEDELEEDDEDDGYAYNSEDYSDMDAGYDELEDEDQRAEREARKEDEREKKKIDDYKREKEAKKKRLEQLAAKQKPHRY